MKYRLIKPIQFDGETIEEINLELDSLKGNDLLLVERQFLAMGDQNQAMMLKELSKEYQVVVAARAAKLPVEFFQEISAKDFSRITMQVQNFFVDGESAAVGE